MSHSQGNYQFAYSKEHQFQDMDNYQTQEQTAGESQHQDQPPTCYGGTELSNPLSAPPVSAPPPPPLSESDAESVPSVNWDDDDGSASVSSDMLALPTPRTVRRESRTHAGYPSSSPSSSTTSNKYHSSYQDSRAAAVPMITNYGVSPSQTFYPRSGESSYGTAKINSSTYRGDTNVRPNTGQTNDEYGGIGSLREITSRLRWLTIACTLTALIWEGFAFPARLLVHTWDHAAKVVLGGYLAFFSLLLLGVELNAPLRDSFGVLYHPLGRSFLLILMSSMCYGIHIDWWELLLCIAFFGCSCGYIYAYIKYPEYRRWQDYHDNHVWADMRTAVRQQAFGENAVQWADPAQRTVAAHVLGGGQRPSWRDAQRETQALLHHV